MEKENPITGIIRANDYAQVWYNMELDCLFLRHVIHEGAACSFVQHESDEEFAPHLAYNNFVYIGDL